MQITGKVFKNMITADVRAEPATAPRCPHADACGGCAFQDRDYADQVRAKAHTLGLLWAEQAPGFVGGGETPALAVVPSPDPYAYRTRMDYVTTRGRFGLRMRGRFDRVVELATCHLIPPEAFQAALLLWQRAQELELPDYNLRTHSGFLRYIVVRRSPQDRLLLAVVTAAGDYTAELEQLAALALEQPGVVGFHWLINDGLSDLSFGAPLRHWGAETLPMLVGANTLHIGPNTFFQNNVHLLMPLLDAVKAAVIEQPDAHSQRIADLYSGVGAIALHLSPEVGCVVGVESHAESSALAEHNILLNGAANVTAQAADVLGFLRDQPAHSFATVVADPPRTGLGAEVCAELLRLEPGRIVYVSCNPLTQLDDVRLLAQHYRLLKLCGYDMFPHTPHVETLAVLERLPTAEASGAPG